MDISDELRAIANKLDEVLSECTSRLGEISFKDCPTDSRAIDAMNTKMDVACILYDATIRLRKAQFRLEEQDRRLKAMRGEF